MKEMHKLNGESSVASKSMIMFVVLNTASLQLVPTTIGALRAEAGAKNPMDIMTSIWFASVLSVISGVVVAKIFERVKRCE